MVWGFSFWGAFPSVRKITAILKYAACGTQFLARGEHQSA